jgi:hypothetical protein
MLGSAVSEKWENGNGAVLRQGRTTKRKMTKNNW